MPLFCAHGVRETIIPKNLHHLEATPQTIHWGYFDLGSLRPGAEESKAATSSRPSRSCSIMPATIPTC